MSASPLRVGVAGVGHLGQHHARIYAELPGCRLVGVADVNLDRAREVAARHGTEAVPDPSLLAGRVDAVSVAVPTAAHLEVARMFVSTGAAVLVEKPIAASLQEADELVEAARRAGVLLAVGHTERFNPAVEALRSRAASPRFIESHRLGSFAPRSLDIDVVLDLMIHDIDIALDLDGGEVASVVAVGVNALTPRVDIANARVEFASGCVANLTASRVSASRTRKIRIFQPESYLSCDCAERSLEHYRLDRSGGEGLPRIVREKVAVPAVEPLRRELECFVQAARGAGRFPVPGRSGRAALEVALRVIASIEAHGSSGRR
ncbi:MAG TPA: Gfo/Idh/MocA family oxidoreductase [Candidatus Polarisedimenticolia bacterium]|nr:Gfo/Idh/MocA family oxidoreductase [Candidatus Polarisedimenticolia bacterium]